MGKCFIFLVLLLLFFVPFRLIIYKRLLIYAYEIDSFEVIFFHVCLIFSSCEYRMVVLWCLSLRSRIINVNKKTFNFNHEQVVDSFP